MPLAWQSDAAATGCSGDLDEEVKGVKPAGMWKGDGFKFVGLVVLDDLDGSNEYYVNLKTSKLTWMALIPFGL